MIFFPKNNEAYLGMFNKGLYVTLSIVFKGHDYAVFVSKSNFSNLMLQWLIRVFSTVRRTRLHWTIKIKKVFSFYIESIEKLLHCLLNL